MLFNWRVKSLSSYVSKVLPATYDALQLMAKEHDLQLTARAYDAKQVTGYNYDWAGVTA